MSRLARAAKLWGFFVRSRYRRVVEQEAKASKLSGSFNTVCMLAWIIRRSVSEFTTFQQTVVMIRILAYNLELTANDMVQGNLL